jgi:hypothetical protein
MRPASALLFCALLTTCPAKAGEGRPGSRKGYALLVGVREYDHTALAPLKYTENDVEELARLLDRTDSPFAGNVRVLTCSRGKTNDRERPTAANFRRELKALLSERKREEMVLLALSGHGVQLEVADLAGKEKPRSFGFFCPSDAQLLGVDFGPGSIEPHFG